LPPRQCDLPSLERSHFIDALGAFATRVERPGVIASQIDASFKRDQIPCALTHAVIGFTSTPSSETSSYRV